MMIHFVKYGILPCFVRDTLLFFAFQLSLHKIVFVLVEYWQVLKVFTMLLFVGCSSANHVAIT